MGAIVPERLTAVVVVVLGVCLLLSGVLATISGHVALGAGAILLGAVLGGFMAPSLTDLHIVTWTAKGVEGPSKTYGLTLGVERASIQWAEIERAGKTGTGYWYFETKDGRRVYWSYLYKGYGSFVNAVREHCPTLILPEDIA